VGLWSTRASVWVGYAEVGAGFVSFEWRVFEFRVLEVVGLARTL
jgi:hypothetical protein